MNKYLTQASTPHLSQTIIRQLVNTNVLLKEHSDKQMEEKRILRKKLIQIERTNSDQTKQLQKQDYDINELRSMNEKLRIENKQKENEIKNFKSSFQSTPSLNKENILTNSSAKTSGLIVDETIEFDDSDLVIDKSSDFSIKRNTTSNNDSDLKYLDELNKFDDKGKMKNPIVISLDDDQEALDGTPSPLAKKRKNPFVAAQNDFDDDEIRPNQVQNKIKMQKFKSFNELSLTVRDSPIDIEIVKPIVSNMKRSRFNLHESDAPIASSSSGSSSISSSSNKAFSYLSDGLGGRSKISNSSTNTTKSNSNLIKTNISNNNNIINAFNSKQIGKKQNFLTKSKVSNFK